MLIHILATGPSMSQELAESLRGENCIVVSDAFRLAPWAMALCAQDHAWWNANQDAKDFAGRKFSSNKIQGVEQIHSKHVGRGSSSGVLSLEVARELGGTEFHLHGFDNRGTHYFGPHKKLRNTTPTRFAEFANQFYTLGQDLKEKGIRVVNKTPHSALECFERG